MDDTLRRGGVGSWIDRFDRFDRQLSAAMGRVGMPLLRIALGVVFVWFGALKLAGSSPAAYLVARTVFFLSPFLPPAVFIPVLGAWEVLIGVSLLYRPLVRLGILLLFLQIPGTFLPLVLLTDLVFTVVPYGLTVEGQYIVKNLVIIGAALVVGGTVRDEA